MAKQACWHRTSSRHVAAALGLVGDLMVWVDAATGIWSACALGAQRTGFATAGQAQAEALRLAREHLEEALRMVRDLELAASVRKPNRAQ